MKILIFPLLFLAESIFSHVQMSPPETISYRPTVKRIPQDDIQAKDVNFFSVLICFEILRGTSDIIIKTLKTGLKAQTSLCRIQHLKVLQ